MAVKPALVDKANSLNDMHCNSCGQLASCIPFVLPQNETAELEKIIEKSLPLKKGSHLFHQGEPFTSLFAVRAGTIKTYTVTSQGEEQITGFYFPGELIALNGIGSDGYPSSAKILETSTVCEIPYEQLDRLSMQRPGLQRQLIHAMANEIREEQQMMLLLSKKTAEERVATFLMKLSERYKQRGYSASIFRLSMSRNEIGNYLGLAVETVSRIFSRFQKQLIIHVEGKEISVLSLDELYQASGDAGDDETSDH